MRTAFFAQAVIGLMAAATTDAVSLQQRAATCAQLPEGSGPKANPDTVSAFLAQPAIFAAANGALTPKAYVKQFGNLQGANIITNQYLGFSSLKSYDVDACAAKCNAVRSCNSFNVYFERDPSQEPGSGNSGCANPCSTTNIKCALFAGSVTAASATNKGQFRNKFQVAIAGSNGYTNALFLVSQARGEIGQSSNSAQPYCSSILGYTTPVVTATVFTTSTPLATTSTTAIQTDLGTTTITIESTATITNTLSTTTTLVLPTTTTATETDSTTTIVLVPTTTIVPSTTIITTLVLSFPTTTTTTATAGGFSKRENSPLTTINGVVALALPASPTISGVQKRAISVPSVLSKYPGSIITSACSLAVSPVTKTSTVTRTRTSTIGTSTATQITSTTTATTTTDLTSTTINTFVSTTEIGTVITNPVVTLTTTTVSTLTQIEVPTVTVTDVISETATVSTTPIVTATTTTTTMAPVCTAATYNFRIVGGVRDGQYLATVDPASSTSVTYAFVTFVTDAASANAWSLSSADRVYSSAANLFSWVTRNNNLYYVLSMSDPANDTYRINPVFCSVQPSAAVAGVPGATGQLVCRRDDGVSTIPVSCTSGGNNLLQTTNVAAAGNGCQAITIAAIPVQSTC